MKFNVERRWIRIIPESDIDKAYIEDTLGLKEEGSCIRLVRIEAVGLGSLSYIQSMTDKQWEGEQEVKKEIEKKIKEKRIVKRPKRNTREEMDKRS